MNLSDLDRRVASTFMAALRSLGDDRFDSRRLPQALFALALQAQTMGLLPRDIAAPNGSEALEAIAYAIFSSPSWQTSPLGARLRAEWSLVVDRAHCMAQPDTRRRLRTRRAPRRVAMASSS